MRSCLLTSLAVGLMLGSAGAKDDLPADHEKILGTWQVVSAEDSGRKAPDEAVKNISLLTRICG